jgi:hypothetical protein
MASTFLSSMTIMLLKSIKRYLTSPLERVDVDTWLESAKIANSKPHKILVIVSGSLLPKECSCFCTLEPSANPRITLTDL